MTELILHVGERLAEADPTEPGFLEQGQPDAMHEVQGVDRLADGGLGFQERFPSLERSRERGGRSTRRALLDFGLPTRSLPPR